jgi:hypothetical protein
MQTELVLRVVAGFVPAIRVFFADEMLKPWLPQRGHDGESRE